MVGLPDFVRDGIIRWAERAAEVDAVWLFGSRARGTQRIDSDIDLAVGVHGWNGSEDERSCAIGDWICLAGGWKEQLATLTPLTIHLSAVSPEDERVLPAVKREGILLYEAG